MLSAVCSLLAAHLFEGREAAAPGHAHRHDGEVGGRDQRVPRPRRLQRRHVLRRGARHQVARAHPALQHGDRHLGYLALIKLFY